VLAAIVLADGAAAASLQLRIAGLTLAERAERVARSVGATEVFVVRDAGDRDRLRAWRPGAEHVLVLRAADQLVHLPLVRPLLSEAAGELRGDAVAVVPAGAAAPDLREGAYAGAFVSARVAELIVELANGTSDRELAQRLLDDGAHARPHGDIARHPVTDEPSRAAAERLLYRILIKPQDNAIARLLFRPLSLPLTRLLARTPITPNQITTITMMMVAVGLWLAARAEPAAVVLGSLVILLSNYVDCCDGEIARLKVRSSRLGAWYDTIVDEVSSLGYMLVLGWHCHLHFGPAYFGGPPLRTAPFDPWLGVMTVGAFTYLVSLYCIYYNIILVARSANSQDYISRVEVVAGDGPDSWQLRPVARQPVTLPASWPRWMAAIVDWMPNIVRRDFIVWASLLLVAIGLTQVVFFAMVGGGVLTATLVVLDHVRLRGQLGLLRDRSLRVTSRA
jgi:CDP-alcohol phosphatidyltransferase